MKKGGQQMDVSIIFTNNKTYDLIVNAIKSIKEKTQGLAYEIIVVDNSNDYREIERLNHLRSYGVSVINPQKDLGFGKGNNLGAEKANGKYVLFLNTDTLLINNAVYEMFTYINNNPEVGIVGANLYNSDLTPGHSFIKDEKNIRNELKYNSIYSSLKRFAKRKRDDFNYLSSPLKINGYVCGAALMMSRSNFLAIGGFDQDIYMYAEESLLCYKMVHDLGLSIYNVPTAKIIHFGGGSFKARSLENASDYIDGTYVYYLKAYGEKTANIMLKAFAKMYMRKSILFCFMDRKKCITYHNLSLACNNKIKKQA